MYKLLELAKKNKVLKYLGKKALKLRECYFRFIADEEGFARYQKEYLELPGCRDGQVNSISDQYLKGNIRKIDRKLVLYYDELWKNIEEHIAKKKSYAIIRVGDGEANFLRGIVKGNTANRHFTEKHKPTKEYLEHFKRNLLKCDLVQVEMYKSVYRAFNGIYEKSIFSPIPLECTYALVASRKLFKSPYKLGIIGADNKIAIIKKLFEHQEYRDYIGRDSFDHYITVPERGSSNDVDKLSEEISKQLDPTIDIYLIGIGIAKLAVMADLKERGNAVFIDVGCGISALAGLVSNTRPYFDDWINFRLKNFDYSAVDVVDADMSRGGTQYV